MEQDKTPSILPEPDRAQFERVWRRVMPENRADCPFTLLTDNAPVLPIENRLMPNGGDPPLPDFLPNTLDETLPSGLPNTLGHTLPAPLPGPSMELRLAPMVPMEKLPAKKEAPALKAAVSPVSGELLQDMISAELSSARTYCTMARRAGGQAAQVFLTISATERRHAKRLSAAYFLLAGVRFWPEGLPGDRENTLWGGIRRRFLSAQKAEAAYRKLGMEAEDPSFKELFFDLAQDEACHAALLRKLLEEL